MVDSSGITERSRASVCLSVTAICPLDASRAIRTTVAERGKAAAPRDMIRARPPAGLRARHLDDTTL